VRLSVCPVRCSVVPRISSAAAELSRGRRTLTSMPSDGHREFSYLNQISVPVERGEHPMQAPTTCGKSACMRLQFPRERRGPKSHISKRSKRSPSRTTASLGVRTRSSSTSRTRRGVRTALAQPPCSMSRTKQSMRQSVASPGRQWWLPSRKSARSPTTTVSPWSERKG
jgi:hypothetical protein